ncbi:isoprenoid synthase [Fadolivirus algeromassiliense]|jgi:hypothetical protein|uniref:Isoprenoid synthase n=1 Tax=Fadolivirus FV1/VV64 TaxID=3070911 RepID=A0A7D3UT91_9VIRU|nr:isoprenoid synthase [Fadolivirus algeromassiliense]QKF94170.1 isoprenoid synthase [Fadolivirus FV1/VV64]
MSRIQKYRESLYRFIKDKSCLLEDQDVNNAQINTYIYNKIKENDLIFSILLLTIMNSQNKKNHISMQGYYIASCIEFLNVSLSSIDNKNEIINKFNNDGYNKLHANLYFSSNRSLQQNLESAKTVYHNLESSNKNLESTKNTYQNNFQGLCNIILNSLSLYNNTIKTINQFSDFKMNITNKSCNTTIIKWYLKNDDELKEKFKTFKQVSKESINEYIDKKYISICELAMSLGWLLGGGEIKELPKLKKLSKYFGMMYKMAKDFENLTNDVKNGNVYTTNYVLNYGLQNGYEVFLNSKQKFIEESSMDTDIYTNTIKEIIDTIEANVDMIIDQTSPDLKSTYSSKAQ